MEWGKGEQVPLIEKEIAVNELWDFGFFEVYQLGLRLLARRMKQGSS